MHNIRLENEILQRVDELVHCALSVGLKNELGRDEQLARGVALVQEMGDLLLEVLEGQEQHLQALLEQIVAQRLPDRRILQSFGNFSHDIRYIIYEGTKKYLDFLREKELTKETPEIHNGQSVSAGVSVDLDNNFYNEDEGPELADAPEAMHDATLGNDVNPLIDDEQLSTFDKSIANSHINANNAGTPANLKASPEPVGNPCLEKSALPESSSHNEIYPEPPCSTSEQCYNNTEILRLALLQAYPGEEIIKNYQTPYDNISFYLPRLQLGFEFAKSRHDWRHDFFCSQKGISIRIIDEEELVNSTFLARRLRRKALWHQQP